MCVCVCVRERESERERERERINDACSNAFIFCCACCQVCMHYICGHELYATGGLNQYP